MRGSALLRGLDRLFGIPIVMALGLFKRKKKWPSGFKPSKIAILNTAAIGDTILLSGIIADLQEAFKTAELVFFCGPSNYSAAQLIPGIRVVRLPVTNPWRSISLLRQAAFDLWIDCGQWPRINAIFTYFAKAGHTVGFRTKGQYRHFIYDQTALHEYVHELQNYRKLLKLVGVEPQSPPKIAAPAVQSSDFLVIHMFPGGSRAELKKWPEAHWIALINALTAKKGQVALTGAKADEEACERIKKQCNDPDRVAIYAGKKTLLETASLLKQSRGVVSVDTGIMHLAAAMGCPTVALHGPTSPERWGGVGPKVVAVLPKRNYNPFLHLGFEKGEDASMKEIEVEQVLSAVERFK